MKELKTPYIKVKNLETQEVIDFPAIKGASAYDQAVEGGYTGTLEDFEKDMGESATNAQAAKDARDDVENIYYTDETHTETIVDKMDSIYTEYKTTATSSIEELESKSASGLNLIAAAKTDAVDTIIADKTDAVDAITSAKTDATGAIATDKSSALTAISDAKTDATTTIATDKASAISAISTEKTTDVEAVQSAGTTAVKNVTDAQTTATTAINDLKTSTLTEIEEKGETTKESIPDDYSELSAQVNTNVTDIASLKEDLAYLAISQKNVSVTDDGTVRTITKAGYLDWQFTVPSAKTCIAIWGDYTGDDHILNTVQCYLNGTTNVYTIASNISCSNGKFNFVAIWDSSGYIGKGIRLYATFNKSTSIAYTIHETIIDVTELVSEFSTNENVEYLVREAYALHGVSDNYAFPLDSIKIKNLNSDVESLSEKIENKKIVSCYGDSLMDGVGDSTRESAIYNILQNNLGDAWSVRNLGVGGESSRTIASRQGGLSIMINGVTIPADGSAVEIGNSTDGFYSNDGEKVYPWIQGYGGSRPLIINGKECNLYYNSYGDSKYRIGFASAQSEAMSITRPTAILTDNMVNHRNEILVIWIGQNGGYSDVDDWIGQIKKMIDYNGNNKYLVLGRTSLGSSDSSVEEQFYQAFGRHYINLREYLITYGLQDAEITPTDIDEEYISEGKVPPSLRISETNVHFNSSGYTVIGNLVYKRGAELLLW